MKAYNAKLPLMAGAGLALLALGGCSDFKQAIGTEKSTPDEFEVVVRPPLSLPPGFSSRPTANSVAQETVVTTATISATSQTSRLLEVRRDTIDGYDDPRWKYCLSNGAWNSTGKLHSSLGKTGNATARRTTIGLCCI